MTIERISLRQKYPQVFAKLNRLFAPAIIVYGLLCNLYLLMHFTCTDCALPQANHLAHWLLVIEIGAWMLAVILQLRRWVYVWLMPGILVFIVWYGVGYLPLPAASPEGISLNAMTFNIQGWQNRVPIEDTWLDDLADVEILVTQETLSEANFAAIAQRYPHSFYSEDVSLYSRFPILESDAAIGDNTPNHVRAVIDFVGQPIVVYGFHGKLPGTFTNYDATENRADADALMEIVSQETLPVILLCDCNFTRHTRQYARFNEHLEDAWRQAGWGFGNTYFASLRLIRIDFVWHSNHFVAAEAEVEAQIGGSDHRPVIARLVLDRDAIGDDQ